MTLAVKSSSSPVMGVVADIAHIDPVIVSQPVIAPLVAPLSVSTHGGGGDAGGGSGGSGGGEVNGHEQTQVALELSQPAEVELVLVLKYVVGDDHGED